MLNHTAEVEQSCTFLVKKKTVSSLINFLFISYTVKKKTVSALINFLFISYNIPV